MCFLIGQGSSIIGVLLCSSNFLASKALHCTLYHAEHLFFSQFQPWMSVPVAPVEHVQLFKVKDSKQSGAQRLSLSRAEHASQQAVSRSFGGSYALVFACFALCHVSFVPQGGEGTVTLGMFPWWCEDTVACRWLLFKWGDPTPQCPPSPPVFCGAPPSPPSLSLGWCSPAGSNANFLH